MDNSTPFRTFGTMLDCSRNAVPNLHTLKKWVDLTASLGYNTLLLYTEDTYEVPDEPYFGYMRGRYTQAELRELDAYAKARGMTIMPCIQTLAHLYAIKRWPEYWPHFDTDDILRRATSGCIRSLTTCSGALPRRSPAGRSISVWTRRRCSRAAGITTSTATATAHRRCLRICSAYVKSAKHMASAS